MFNRKIAKIFYGILMIIPLIPLTFFISYLSHYSGINGQLRLYISMVLIFMTLAFACLGLFFLKKKNKIGLIIMGLVAVSLSFGSGYVASVNANFYKSLSQMTSEQATIYYNLVTLSENNINELNELKGKRIAILNMSNQSVSNHIQAYLKENNLEDTNEVIIYDSPIEMVHDLYDNKVDAIIIGSNFKSLFSEKEGFATIEEDTVILDVIQVITEQINNSRTSLTEQPFSILLIGIDSTEGIEQTGLADSLILATFNPQNLSMTLTSIPRDSYVSIPYFNYAKDKITHSNNGGTNAVIGAVENLFDMEIPYYVKVNFSAVVELVDTLGGIEVNVPMAFEEQNSQRQFGDYLIKLDKGLQILNGEEALALARHRKTIVNGDIGRANNQQLVIEGIINKALSEMDTVNEFLALLTILGNNIETNLTINDMTDFAQYLLELVPTFNDGNPLDAIHMMNMVLSGESQKVMTPYYSFPLSVFLPYEGAIYDARSLMLINLNQEDPLLKHEFYFNGFEFKATQWLRSIYSETIKEGQEIPERPLIDEVIEVPQNSGEIHKQPDSVGDEQTPHTGVPDEEIWQNPNQNDLPNEDVDSDHLQSEESSDLEEDSSLEESGTEPPAAEVEEPHHETQHESQKENE